MQDFLYCPFCGAKEINKKYYYLCSHCKEKYYKNPKPCVSIIPIKNEKILLAKRGVNPFKGEYDFIGGFVNIGEKVEDAAVRETKEETGLDIKLMNYLGSSPDIYDHKENHTLGFIFTAEIIKGEIKAQDDVASLEWVPISKIPELKLNGFKNTREGLNDLLTWWKKNKN